MLVHRIDVIGVMQNHAEQPAKLGDKSSKNVATVHLQQRLVHPLLPSKDLEKGHIGRRRTAEAIVDQSSVLAQKLPRFVTQLPAMLLHLGEDLNEVARLRLENIGLGDRELALRNVHSLADGLGHGIKSAKKRPWTVRNTVNSE